MPMTMYHRTTQEAANIIIHEGLRDGCGFYFMVLEEPLEGVFLSDIPVDFGEGAKADVLLEVKLDLLESEIADGEIVEDTGGLFKTREWCIPADLINRNAKVRLITIEEEDELAFPWDRWVMPVRADDPRIVAWRKAQGFPSGGLG